MLTAVLIVYIPVAVAQRAAHDVEQVSYLQAWMTDTGSHTTAYMTTANGRDVGDTDSTGPAPEAGHENQLNTAEAYAAGVPTLRRTSQGPSVKTINMV
jgi:hypothetical protein